MPGKLIAKLREPRVELTQPGDLLRLEREVAPSAGPVAPRHGRDSEVRNAMYHVLERMRTFAALKLGIQRQRCHPNPWRVAHLADWVTSVGEQNPRALLVVAKYLGYSVGPSRE